MELISYQLNCMEISCNEFYSHQSWNVVSVDCNSFMSISKVQFSVSWFHGPHSCWMVLPVSNLCPGTPPVVKGLIWFTDGFRMVEGVRGGVYGQSVGRRLSISLGKHATVFQTEVYVILACVHETDTQDRPDKYVFALTARWLWQHFRLPKQCLHWCDSAKRCWMMSLAGTL